MKSFINTLFVPVHHVPKMESLEIASTAANGFLISAFIMSVIKFTITPVIADLPSNRSEIETRLKAAGIIPGLFDRAPKYVLEIKYAGGVTVDFGNILDSSKVKQMPVSLRWPANLTTFYTLIATDPDSYVSRPSRYHEWQHWIVGNIPGICFLAGETLTPYMGALAPHWIVVKRGLHRFIFTVYEQKQGKIFFTAPRLPAMFDARRTNFSTRMFTQEYELGQPLAINYFRVEPKEVTARPRKKW